MPDLTTFSRPLTRRRTVTLFQKRRVVPGLLPDPRAWLGREAQRPASLVDDRHFEPFDRARSAGAFTGPWTLAEVEAHAPEDWF